MDYQMPDMRQITSLREKAELLRSQLRQSDKVVEQAQARFDTLVNKR